jgi:inorganic triphosphatase YgiF
MADRGREIELKLEIDPADIAALKAHPLLAASIGKTHRQVSTYFDTPKQQLRKSCLALRVREIDGRFIQTVKGAGLFDRPEWEKQIAGPEPTPGSLSDTPVAPANLRPIFAVTVDRTAWHIREGGSEIEMVLDRGDIRAGNRHDNITEVELELKQGSPEDIFAFAHKLAASVPLRLGILTKSERGYLLHDDALGKPVKAIAAAVAPGMTAETAFRAIAGACIRQFRLNEPLFIRDRNSGALHQCRVALRRLRSAFSMFGRIIADDWRDALAEGLRWISADLGDARDLDVFIAKRIPKSAASDAMPERDEAFTRAIAALNSHRFRTLMLELAEWLALGKWQTRDRDQPIEDFAESALDRFWRKVKKGGRHLADIDDEDRHAVRIAAKKLRYGCEFFAPLHDGTKQFITTLADLQEHLGDLNDIVTARILAARFPGIALTDEPDRALLLAAAEKTHIRLTEIGPFWR